MTQDDKEMTQDEKNELLKNRIALRKALHRVEHLDPLLGENKKEKFNVLTNQHQHALRMKPILEEEKLGKRKKFTSLGSSLGGGKRKKRTRRKA